MATAPIVNLETIPAELGLPSQNQITTASLMPQRQVAFDVGANNGGNRISREPREGAATFEFERAASRRLGAHEWSVSLIQMFVEELFILPARKRFIDNME
jgi:hypothetical protein